MDRIDIEFQLPQDFSEKYKKALRNSANSCTVKRHLHDAIQVYIFQGVKELKIYH